METKSFFSSKLNRLGLALTLIGALSDPQYSPLVNALIPPEYLPKIMSAAGLLAMVLRTFFTDTAVTIGKRKDDIVGILVVCAIPAAAGAICILLGGCTTIGDARQRIPAGCEKSVLYATAPASFIALDAARVYACSRGAGEYAQVQKVAQVLQSVLSKPEASWIDLESIPSGWLVMGAALMHGHVGFVDACDKDILVGYAKSF